VPSLHLPKFLIKRGIFLFSEREEEKGVFFIFSEERGGSPSPLVTGELALPFPEGERGQGHAEGVLRTESFGRRREATLRLKTLRLGSLALQKKPSKPPSEAKNIMGDGT
jgi:hypothetical protein